jgi:hypothetical protein
VRLKKDKTKIQNLILFLTRPNPQTRPHHWSTRSNPRPVGPRVGDQLPLLPLPLSLSASWSLHVTASSFPNHRQCPPRPRAPVAIPALGHVPTGQPRSQVAVAHRPVHMPASRLASHSARRLRTCQPPNCGPPRHWPLPRSTFAHRMDKAHADNPTA